MRAIRPSRLDAKAGFRTPTKTIMTPIGHASVGYLIGQLLDKSVKGKKTLSFFLGAILPDVDLIFLWSSYFKDIHRLYTHSFVFLAAAGLIVRALMKRWSYFWLFLLGGLTHLTIDAIMDNYPANGLGVPLLSPFSFKMFNFSFFFSVTQVPGWYGFVPLAKNLLFESPLFILAILLFLIDRRRNPGGLSD